MTLCAFRSVFVLPNALYLFFCSNSHVPSALENQARVSPNSTAITWPELARLATDVIEAGVHFQDTVLYNRKKDARSVVGDWFNELMKLDPWFKDVVPNVLLQMPLF